MFELSVSNIKNIIQKTQANEPCARAYFVRTAVRPMSFGFAQTTTAAVRLSARAQRVKALIIGELLLQLILRELKRRHFGGERRRHIWTHAVVR